MGGSDNAAFTFHEDPTGVYDEKFAFGFTGLKAQFFYLACHFLFYGAFIVPVASVFYSCLKKHKNFDQYEVLNKHMIATQFQATVNLQAAGWVGAQLLSICGIQHAIGTLLCLPAVCNIYGYTGLANFLGISPAFAIFLAKQGAMCEAGWELSDVVFRCYSKWVQGRHDLNPKSLMIFAFVHHTMGLSMVVPMCAFDGGNPYFHEVVFLLQGAAAVGITAQQFGFLLDIRNAGELFTMKIYIVTTLFCMVWCRGIRYVSILYSIVMYYSAFEMYTMLIAAVLAALVMGFVNALFVVDSISKASKYLPMTTEQAVKMAATKSE